MATSKPALLLLVPVMLVLAACSSPSETDGGPVDTPAAVGGGAIELALTETCTDASDAECVSVNGSLVLLPPAFERAGVDEVAVAEGGGQNAVDVTFDEEGAAVFSALTEEAVDRGGTTRLVVGIGGEMRTAVTVMQAMQTDEVQIVLGPDDSPREIAELIREG